MRQQCQLTKTMGALSVDVSVTNIHITFCKTFIPNMHTCTCMYRIQPKNVNPEFLNQSMTDFHLRWKAMTLPKFEILCSFSYFWLTFSDI